MMIRLSERSGKVLLEAYKTAGSYGTEYIGTEHILKGILEENGVAAKILQKYKLTSDRMVEVLNNFNGQEAQEFAVSDEMSGDQIYQLMMKHTPYFIVATNYRV